jgi:hypothetical protein
MSFEGCTASEPKRKVLSDASQKKALDEPEREIKPGRRGPDLLSSSAGRRTSSTRSRCQRTFDPLILSSLDS